MIQIYRITQLVFMSFFIALALPSVHAADPNEVVKEEEITLQKIKSYL